MTAAEGSYVDGGGSQTGGLTRWGDYSAMTVDPADDCTFWFSGEYLASNGSFNWHTRLGSFKLAGCGVAPPADDFSLTLSPSAGSATAGASVGSTVSTATTNGSPQTVAFSATGLPAGAAASFTPAGTTAAGSATMSITTTAGTTPGGSYPITVTATGTGATHSATYTLTVTVPCPTGQKLGNPGFEGTSSSPWSFTGRIGTASTEAPHTGTSDAWLNGRGTTRTDTLSQVVSVPAGCSSYTFSFWLHIDSADTSRKVRDRLSVQVLSGGTTTTLDTFTNTNRANGYTQHSYSLAVFAGKSVTIRFTGTEDRTLQTSFVVDDTALDVA
jgi:hypothetical protein